MTVSSASRPVQTYTPGDLKRYCDADLNSPVATIQNMKPASHSMMLEILKNWKEVLFPSSNPNYSQEKTTILLHQEVREILQGNKPASEEVLKKIHEVFVRCAEGKEGDQKHELLQMALHPRMMMRACEDYIQGSNMRISFSIDAILSELRQHNLCSEEVCQAIRSRQNDLFPEDYLDLDGLKDIDNVTPQAPNFNSERTLTAFENAVCDMLRIVRHGKKNQKSGQEIEAEIKNMLMALKGRFELGNLVSSQLDNVKRLENELASRLAEHGTHKQNAHNEEADYKSRIDQLTLEIQEAEKAIYYYPTTKEHLAPVIASKSEILKTTSEEAAEKLKANQEKAKELYDGGQAIASEYKEATATLAASCKQSGIKAESVDCLSDDILNQIQILADNAPILRACYEEYLMYADNNASREIQPAAGWFSLWS